MGEDGFQLLVEQAGDAFFILNYEGAIQSVNTRACRSVGYSREELLGMNVAEVDTDVDPKRHRRDFWDHLEAGQHVTFEGTHRRKDGSTFPVEVRLGRLDMPTERLLLALARDITSRKQKEEDIERHREFERLVAKISTRFVGLSGPEFEQAIQTALGDICTYFDVDAVRLYRLSPGGEVLKFRLNWVSGHLAPPKEMEVIHGSTYPAIASRHMKGESTIFGSLSECPQIPEFLNILKFFGTRAGVGVSLEIDASGVDIFAMDKVLADHVWPKEAVDHCKTIGRVILSAITRREAELDLADRFSEIQQLKNRLEQENIYLQDEIEINQDDELIGKSHVFRAALVQAKQVASTDSTVLLLGETGTGKGLLARRIHELSGRSQRPMITVNCAALPSSLIESELFGHEKGAFTGAIAQKIGRFELADGGTIFLDEVGDLPIDLQAKLLRVLQEQEFERLGSSTTRTVDARVIAATNRDLDKLIEQGEFRADLYYRLGVFPIRAPALRERRGDIPLLFWFFISELRHRLGKEFVETSAQTMAVLTDYDWPGNVRELKNIVERAMILSTVPELRLGDWFPGRRDSTGIAFRPHTQQGETLEEVERVHMEKVLVACDWKIRGEGGAAERLGLKRTTLQSRMKKLGIERPRP